MLCYLKSYTDLRIRLLGEAYHEFGAERLRNTGCLLTLGTGHSPRIDIESPPHINWLKAIWSRMKLEYPRKVIKSLSNIATDCEKAHKKAQSLFRAEVYWRFNCEVRPEEKVVALDHWQGMAMLTERTREFVERTQISREIERCATRLQ